MKLSLKVLQDILFSITFNYRQPQSFFTIILLRAKLNNYACVYNQSTAE